MWCSPMIWITAPCFTRQELPRRASSKRDAKTCAPPALAASVLKAIEEAGRELLTGALVTIDVKRHRISVLPLKQ